MVVGISKAVGAVLDRYWVIVILVGAAFGSAFYFNAILLEDFGPVTVAFARVGTAALASWVFLFATGRSGLIPGEMILPLAVLGVLTFAVPLLAYPFAQQHIGPGVTGITNAMTPAMTVQLP